MPPLPPRVTIGMPVHNGEPHLPAALRSLLDQSFEDFELVVADNASTDRTRQIVSEVASRDRRVVIQHRTRPVSAATNFNGVLGSARGEYFMWAADDDLWAPSFMERLVGLLHADRSAVLAFCPVDNVDPTADSVVRRIDPALNLSSPDVVERMLAFLMADETGGKANLVYGLARRRDLASTGGMVDWRGARWGADMLTVFRVLGRGRVVWDDEVMFSKRLADEEMSFNPPVDGVPVPLRQLLPWHGYLLGYLRIIASTSSLRAVERRRLLGALVAKGARGDRAAMRRLARRLRLVA